MTEIARWLVAMLAAVSSQAAAQTSREPPPPPTSAKARPPVGQPEPDPAYAASQAAFEALPEALRKAIQDSLVWTGDYNAVTAGTFGRRTFEGIAAWQKRQGLEPTGILAVRDRAALDAAGEAARKAMRFTAQADRASGAVIGVPEKLLAKKGPLARGTRWQSADGRITLDTASYPPETADLDALFERAATATPDRKVTYKLKKPDFIVVTGETATGRFYIRHAAGPLGIRGFTMAYDKALTAEVDRLVIAVANSFLPFPESTPTPEPSAAATLSAAPAGSAKPAVPFAAPPLPGTSAHPAATGLALGNGRVLTASAPLDACPTPRIGGVPVRPTARDASGALALLETEPRNVPSSALPEIRADAPGAGEALVVLGAGDRGVANVSPGTAGAGSVTAPLQPGAGGAPVLDRAGRLVGLIARFPAAPRLIAGVMPPTSYALIPGDAIAALVKQAGLSPGRASATAPASLGAVAAPVLGAIVAIECDR